MRSDASRPLLSISYSPVSISMTICLPIFSSVSTISRRWSSYHALPRRSITSLAIVGCGILRPLRSDGNVVSGSRADTRIMGGRLNTIRLSHSFPIMAHRERCGAPASGTSSSAVPAHLFAWPYLSRTRCSLRASMAGLQGLGRLQELLQPGAHCGRELGQVGLRDALQRAAPGDCAVDAGQSGRDGEQAAGGGSVRQDVPGRQEGVPQRPHSRAALARILVARRAAEQDQQREERVRDAGISPVEDYRLLAAQEDVIRVEVVVLQGLRKPVCRKL